MVTPGLVARATFKNIRSNANPADKGTGVTGLDGDGPGGLFRDAVAFYAACGDHRCWFNASASTNSIGTTSYSWDYGDGDTGSGEQVSHMYARSYDSVTVTLTVTDQYGLSDSESMTVALTGGEERGSANNRPPSADFTTECTGLACTFTSTSTDDTGIESYLWSTGDGAAAGTESEHKHTYGSAGTYTVTLMVRDGHGGFGAALYQIPVGDP